MKSIIDKEVAKNNSNSTEIRRLPSDLLNAIIYRQNWMKMHKIFKNIQKSRNPDELKDKK